MVVAAASAAGFVMRQRQGRFHAARSTAARSTAVTGTGEYSFPALWRRIRQVSDVRNRVLVAADTGRPPSSDGVLSATDLGAPLGAQATLVQFSTAVCAYCGPTRKLLTEVARDTGGVAFVEVDAAERMDLTRRLHVLSTPTVLVLDALGGITSRASGPLRKADLLTAVGAVLDDGGAP
jgi:Thioredoxin